MVVWVCSVDSFQRCGHLRLTLDMHLNDVGFVRFFSWSQLKLSPRHAEALLLPRPFAICHLNVSDHTTFKGYTWGILQWHWYALIYLASVNEAYQITCPATEGILTNRLGCLKWQGTDVTTTDENLAASGVLGAVQCRMQLCNSEDFTLQDATLQCPEAFCGSHHEVQ